MVIDEWQVPVEPVRSLKRDVTTLRDGAKEELDKIYRKLGELEKQILELTNAINELISIIKKEVSSPPIKKKELPPPPLPEIK